MTNQEAITKLTNIMHDDHYSWHPSVLTAFDMAVDALKGADIVCGACEHSDSSTLYATIPPKVQCRKTGNLHFVTDSCECIESLSAQPTHDNTSNALKSLDCIDRQAAIDVIDAVFPVDAMKSEYTQGIACGAALAKTYVEQLPSAQPEQLERCPIYGGMCAYPSDQCYDCPRHHGAQPEQWWIPWDSGEFPEESGTYTVTAYDGVTKRVTFAKYQKRLKRWELTGARAYWRVLAWRELPEPWKEGEADD